MLNDKQLQQVLIQKDYLSTNNVEKYMKSSRVKFIIQKTGTNVNIGPGSYFKEELLQSIKNNPRTAKKLTSVSIGRYSAPRLFNIIENQQINQGYQDVSSSTYNPVKQATYQAVPVIMHHDRESTSYKQNFCFQDCKSTVSPDQYKFEQSHTFMDKYNKIQPQLSRKNKFRRFTDNTTFLGPGCYEQNIEKEKKVISKSNVRKYKIE